MFMPSSASPLLQCGSAVEIPMQVDLMNLQVILVKDSASSNASISWRYFGLLATASSSPSSSSTNDNTFVGTEVEPISVNSPVPSLASSDAELLGLSVLNRSFYYCKLCLEREQDEYRSTAGRHGSLSNVHKYSVHTATTAYKTHLFNAHGVIDKLSTVCSGMIKLETSNVDDFTDYSAAPAYFSSLSKKQTSSSPFVSSKTETPAWTTEEFHRDVCNWLVCDLRSLDTVASSGFGEFCSKNFPHFAAPYSTNLGRNWLDQVCSNVKDRVKVSLCGVRAVCVMIDAWNDRYRRIPFFGVRLSYVEPVSWTFRTVLLSVKVVPHMTGIERATHVRAELRNFSVSDDCVLYTTDDGSDAARHCGRLLKSAYETVCVARSLDRLLVTDALDQVHETSRLIGKCVMVVETLYNRIGVTTEYDKFLPLNKKVANIKEFIDLDEQVAVCVVDDNSEGISVSAEDCDHDMAEGGHRNSNDRLIQKAQASCHRMCSRWNIILLMLEGLIEMSAIIPRALVKCGCGELCFDEQELNTMKALIQLLAPFREFSEMVSGNHPHLGLLLMIRDQIDDFCRPCRRDSEAIAAVKRKIRQNLDRRIPLDDMVLATSILEPGTRAIVAVDQEEQIRVIAKVWNEHENELSTECSAATKPKVPSDQRTSPVTKLPLVEDHRNVIDASEPPCSKETGAESKRKRIIKQILQRRGLSIGGEETIQSEVTRYLNTKATEEEERAPLTFWKNNQKNFPRLHRLARNLLSIVTGSVLVEELFSEVGLNRNGKRAQLKPYEMNQISIIHDNYSII